MNLNEPKWEQLIQEQRTSGKTIEEFCANRGVNKSTFKKRKYGIGKKPTDLVKEFIEVPRRTATLSVKLKNGRILEISSGFNESEVHRLIRLLESC